MGSANRWVFYQQQEDGLPVFADLIWHDKSLFQATGGSFTIGSSEEKTFDNEAALTEYVQAERAKLEKAGFELTRQWEHSPNSIDFDLLQKELEDALGAVIKASPAFNALAIYTDSDRITLSAAVGELGPISEVDDDSLFIVDEWSLIDVPEMSEISYRLIMPYAWYKLTELDCSAYRSAFDEACIRALEALDAEGAFGEKRDRVVLYYISDNEQSDSGMRRLNSPELYARWSEWIGDDKF